MTIGTEAFKNLEGSRFVRATNIPGDSTYRTEEYGFFKRVALAFSSGVERHGNTAERAQNRDFNNDYYNAMLKAEGRVIADRVASKAGIRKLDGTFTGKPTGEREIHKMRKAAQEYRQRAIKETLHEERRYLSQSSKSGFKVEVEAAGLRRPSDLAALKADYRTAVRQHQRYGERALTDAELKTIGQETIAKFKARKEAVFREMHPDLAAYAASPGTFGVPNLDVQTFFDEVKNQLAIKPLTQQTTDEFRTAARELLTEYPKIAALRREMVYDTDAMGALYNRTTAADTKLMKLEVALRRDLATSPSKQPPTQGDLLRDALIRDVAHQRELLAAKSSFIGELIANNPLSQKTVMHSELMWAKAIGTIVDEAVAEIEQRIQSDPNMLGAEKIKCRQAQRALLEQKGDVISKALANYNNPQITGNTYRPGDIANDQHPATLAKTNAVERLKDILDLDWMQFNYVSQKTIDDQKLSKSQVQRLNERQIERLTSPERIARGLREALNTHQDWVPIEREIVAHRGDLTRTYESRIIPASQIDDRFAKSYGGRGKGVSAITKDDQEHARNLKVSELGRQVPDGQGGTKYEKISTVIGHGVLDMWDVATPADRQKANDSAAREVITAAITSSDRLRKHIDNSPNKVVQVTHVSVNEITPAPWREMPGMADSATFHDYQEKTYTEEQFRAFAALDSRQPGSDHAEYRDFTIDDGKGGEQQISVDLRVIAFSFGLNGLATGPVPDFMGGWAEVYEYNKMMMERFVGDIGEGAFGSQGSRPGGFIGGVMDRLDPGKPEEAELLGRMQAQADIVRAMFSSEDFKRGNGDPGKMSRHILALQTLADAALDTVDAETEAATMSRGCKSDKDRGGVIDVELKFMLITEDMGGHVLPDAKLEGDDLQNYYAVATSSGQLENQTYNTSLPGSKEAGKLKDRLPDAEVRRYLSGLGAFTAE